jgi:2EXR family
MSSPSSNNVVPQPSALVTGSLTSAMSGMALDIQTNSTQTMTYFPKFPQEIKDMIWGFTVEPEIISIQIRRKVNEAPSKKKQKRGGAARKQFTFEYIAGAIRVDLNGEFLPLSGLRSASRESRAAYFDVRPDCIHLLENGAKIHFNPSFDILHFGNLSSIYSHMMRQRLRWPLPFLKGLHLAKKIVFDAKPDDEDYSLLAEEVIDEFFAGSYKILLSWIMKGKSYKKDADWAAAVSEEEVKLKRAMTKRKIQRSGALGRVNGGYIDVGAKILRLPLKDMEGTGSEGS